MVKHEEIKVVLQGRTHLWYSKLVSWFLHYQYVHVWYDIYACLMSNIFLERRGALHILGMPIFMSTILAQRCSIFESLLPTTTRKMIWPHYLPWTNLVAGCTGLIKLLLCVTNIKPWTKNNKQLKKIHQYCSFMW